MIKITACICTYNRYDLLPIAIKSLEEQESTASYEILVIDNSPINDEIKKYTEKYKNSSKVKFHWLETPGLSNARNYAVSVAKGEIIAFMDDDAIANTNWLDELIYAFESLDDDLVVCVGGRVIPIWESPRPTWLHDWLLGYVSVVDWGNADKPRYAKDHEWMAGTNISFKVDFLKSHGLFDTKLGRNGDGKTLLSNEEIQISQNIKKNGFKTVYSERAYVDHLVPSNRLSQEWFRKRVLWQAISDFMINGNSQMENMNDIKKYALDYMWSMPPGSRNVYSLFYDQNDPELFLRQLKTVEILIACILNEKHWINNEIT